MVFYKDENKQEFVKIYGDEFYTICPNCKVVEPLEEIELGRIAIEDGISGTSIYCASCTAKGLVPKVLNGEKVEQQEVRTSFESETLNVGTILMDKDALVLEIWDEDDGNLTACLDQQQVQELAVVLLNALNDMKAEEQ